MGAVYVSPQENLENGYSLNFVKKMSIFFTSEQVIILKSYYMQYPKQVHKKISVLPYFFLLIYF